MVLVGFEQKPCWSRTRHFDHSTTLLILFIVQQVLMNVCEYLIIETVISHIASPMTLKHISAKAETRATPQ